MVRKGIVAVLFLVMASGLVYLYSQNQALAKELSESQKKTALYKNQLEKARENFTIMTQKYNDIKGTYSFYETKAVIVTEDNQYYHSYGCSEITLYCLLFGDYRILDKEHASESGYYPCPYCQ
ncbi:MAG: hypothetical protein IK116_08890 [Firmicutes bacterium]|nr:hypothetical protein [Bacillota bacterium]